MFHFLQNFFAMGTINVLQGGGGSEENGQRPYFCLFVTLPLDPSLVSGHSHCLRLNSRLMIMVI